MGLRADIYKAAAYGSCSNGGVSEHCDAVTIVNAEGPFEPTPDAPAVAVVHGNLPGTVKAIVLRELKGTTDAQVITGADGRTWTPLRPEGGVGPMMGGCFIDGDSRLGELCAKLGASRYGSTPVALHDRFEGAALYASMSDGLVSEQEVRSDLAAGDDPRERVGRLAH